MTAKKSMTAKNSRKDSSRKESNQDIQNKNNKKDAHAVQSAPQDNYKMANYSILFLMIIAGAVSGILSYVGAESIYQAKHISIPFAIVVEGVIILTLWLLPKRLAWEKVLLMSIWAIGVTFSIFSAHLHSYKGTVAQRDAQTAKMQVLDYISGIEDYGKGLLLAARDAAVAAEAELEGKYGSERGPGPKYREKLKIADAASQKHKAFEESVREPIEKAKTDLKSDNSLSDVQDIYADLASIPAEYRSELKQPNITEAAANNPLRVILSLLGAINNVITGKSVDDSQAQEIMALAVASLMEVMALLLGLARVVLLRPIKEGTLSMHKKLHSMIAWVFNTRYVFQDAAEEVAVDRKNKQSKKTSTSRKNRNTERKPNEKQLTLKEIRELINKALHSDANKNGIPYIKIVQQVSGLRGTRSGGNNSIETFTIRNFEGLEITLRAMEQIDAVKIHSDEKIIVSTKWGDFIKYILAQAAIKAIDTPKAARYAA